jgi:hypothetical protein
MYQQNNLPIPSDMDFHPQIKEYLPIIAQSIINTINNTNTSNDAIKNFIYSKIAENNFMNSSYAHVFNIFASLLLLKNYTSLYANDTLMSLATIAISFYMSGVISNDDNLRSNCSPDYYNKVLANVKTFNSNMAMAAQIMEQTATNNVPQVTYSGQQFNLGNNFNRNNNFVNSRYSNNDMQFNNPNAFSQNNMRVPIGVNNGNTTAGSQNLFREYFNMGNQDSNFRRYDTTNNNISSNNDNSFGFRGRQQFQQVPLNNDRQNVNKTQQNNVKYNNNLVWLSTTAQPYKYLIDIKLNVGKLRQVNNTVIEDIEIANEEDIKKAGVDMISFNSIGKKKLDNVENAIDQLNSITKEDVKSVKEGTATQDKKALVRNLMVPDWVSQSNLSSLVDTIRLKKEVLNDNVWLYRGFGVVYRFIYGINEQDFVTECSKVTNFSSLQSILLNKLNSSKGKSKYFIEQLCLDLDRLTRNFIRYELNKTEKEIKIAGFLEDINELREWLLTNYGIQCAEAFDVFEKNLLFSLYKPYLSDVVDVLDTSVDILTDDVKLLRTVLPTTYSITAIDLSFKELNLRLLEDEVYLIDNGLTPLLSKLVESINNHNTTMGYKIYNNCIVTRDNKLLSIRKALLMPGDNYIIYKDGTVL